MLTNNIYLKISPAQAVYSSQSGKIVYKKSSTNLQKAEFVQVNSHKEFQSNEEFFIGLSKTQVECELNIASSYQTRMTLFSMALIISSILLAFNHDQDVNSLMLILSLAWIFSSISIVGGTISYHKDRTKRKSYYLYGKMFLR